MPDPEVDIDAYWRLAKDYPKEWKELVKLYLTSKEDRKNLPKQKSDLQPAAHNRDFPCSLCDEAFGTYKSMSVHKWAKHRVKSGVRDFVGNISVCPICSTDFCSRARLVKHLSERRIRSKLRTVTCQQAFLRSQPQMVNGNERSLLEARDADTFRKARKEGHTNVIATIPCKKHPLNNLKRPRSPRAHTHEVQPRLRKRHRTNEQ